ncbi:MFS transporter [Streptomyces sp. CB09001]|uniref:MFS transporter n=1 Tax=Streptomyces sp. CB09001 TaxID=2083284 RepID=UPI000E20DC6C|nr:MFS transporter [Streptomyces sp. CB09001]AXL92613.1 MFS transporter [Streptomyces sp. CB09001]
MPKGYSLRLYLTAATAARAGEEMSGPALLLAGLAVTGSTTDASTLLAGITVSAAVGGPLLGALLDRAGRPGRLLAGALALYATGLLVILAGLGRLPMACTLPLAVLTGLLGPALSGGWTAQLPRVAAHARLPRANALDAMTFGMASLAGPALTGGAAVLLGASTALALAAALITAALPAAWRLPARTVPDRDTRPGTVAGALAAGFRVVLRRPLLARATFTSVTSCAAQGMLAACVPLLGAQWLGAAGRGVLLFSGAAVSALAANAVLARRPLAVAPDTVVRAGALVQAVALTLAATGRPVALVVAVLVLGIGEGPQLTALFAVRHREAPEHLRGQVFTTGASLKITAFALGVAVAGPLAAWSLPGTLTLAAGTAAAGALALGRESV